MYQKFRKIEEDVFKMVMLWSCSHFRSSPL